MHTPDLDQAVDDTILLLIQLKKTKTELVQDPLAIIKLVICGLDTLLKAIINWIPTSDTLVLKILGAIESVLSIACAVIPVAKESVV